MRSFPHRCRVVGSERIAVTILYIILGIIAWFTIGAVVYGL